MAYFAPLRKKLEAYLDNDQIDKVYEAYLLAEKAHEPQKRSSGEPYITHPVAVACVLADTSVMRLASQQQQYSTSSSVWLSLSRC